MDRDEFFNESVGALSNYVLATMSLVRRAIEAGLATPDEVAALEAVRTHMLDALFDAGLPPDQVDHLFDNANAMMRKAGFDID